MNLTEFFVCCTDGVWKVSALRINGKAPLVEHIALRSGEKPSTNRTLKGGTCVAISTQGISLYFQPRRYEIEDPIRLTLPEETEPFNFGDKTGKLLACFLTKEEAIEENAKNKSSNMDIHFDFHEPTIKVLSMIGDNHPVFVITRNNKEEYYHAFPLGLYDDISMNRGSVPTFSREVLIDSLERMAPGFEVFPSEPKFVFCAPVQKVQKPHKEKVKKTIITSPKGPEFTSKDVLPQKQKPQRTHDSALVKKFTETKLLPMAQRIFLTIATARQVKLIEGGSNEVIKGTWLARKHEVVSIASPIADTNDPWLVDKEELAHGRISGNSERAWKQFFPDTFDINCIKDLGEFLVVKTTEPL